MGRNVTGFDVARLAGVSQPTVSRALRNLPGTSETTRAAVLAAARELSYVPSDSGRSLSTHRTRRAAIVSEGLTNPYYPELVEPLRRALGAHQLRTVLVTDPRGAANPGPDVDDLADGSYEGVILTTTQRHSTLPRDLTERGVPHVLANRRLDRAESPTCCVDNRAGATAVADLLADLGHTRIGSVQGPTPTSTGRERAHWLRERLRRRGSTLPRRYIRRTPAFSHDHGFAAAHDLLALEVPPTAIACGNDVLALGVLSAARERGVRVPEELTVVGFDDIPMAGWPLVGLTTVRCPLEEMARRAVDLLLAEIAEPGQSAAEQLVPVDLVLRTTHAPPRSA